MEGVKPITHLPAYSASPRSGLQAHREDIAGSRQLTGWTRRPGRSSLLVMPTSDLHPLLIRRSLTTGVIFGVITAGGAMFFAVAIGTRLYRGGSVEGTAWLWLLTLTGMAAWCLRDVIDRRVQVRFTAEGLRDHRTGGALVPWSVIRKANDYVANGSSMIEFTIGPDDARDVGSDWLEGSGRHRATWPERHVVRVAMENLDASSADVIAFVRRAAPHVEIPGKLDLLRGWVDG
jgi:hypothetical protein